MRTLTPEKVEKLLDKLERSKMDLPRFAKSHGISLPALTRELNQYNPSRFEAVKESRRCSKDKLYRRGRSFEYQVQAFLRTRGWMVIRSPQSKSPTDLVAIKKNRGAWLIQCKAGSSSFGPKERQELADMAAAAGAVAVLGTRPKRGTILLYDYLNKVELTP